MKATTKQHVITALRANHEHIASLGVRRIGLFGSFVHDRAADDSDIDLLVEFDPDRKTFANFMALSYFLEDLLDRRVELVTRESLSPHIGPHILSEVEYVPLAA